MLPREEALGIPELVRTKIDPAARWVTEVVTWVGHQWIDSADTPRRRAAYGATLASCARTARTSCRHVSTDSGIDKLMTVPRSRPG